MKKFVWILPTIIIAVFVLISCSSNSDKIEEVHDYSQYPEYTEEWLDKSTAKKTENNHIDNIVITEIYSNCFLAEYIVSLPYQIKLNGSLSDEWCVGDYVSCTCDNYYESTEGRRIEADFLSIEKSDFELDPDACYKPVIYLYPEEATDVSVKLDLNGGFTCTYPDYNNGWNVRAYPDGTLVDKNGKEYNYLYWEGETYTEYDFSEGFCVKGEDTAEFLEVSLEKLGLNRREANEFIVYWLPLMQENEYNLIAFQTDAYTESAKLEIIPEPDSLVRVFMAYKASDEYVEIEEQELVCPEKNGFVAVEWGGTEVK